MQKMNILISTRLEIRNQHVEMHQIPSMEEKSVTASAKPVSLLRTARSSYWLSNMGGELSKRQGVLFHWWPFGSKRNDRLKLF